MSAPDLFVIETNLPPDPLALARAIWDSDRPVLLLSEDRSRPSFVACEPSAEARTLDPEPALSWIRQTPRRGSRTDRAWPYNFGFAPRWIGVLPYEHERGRLERLAYRRPERRPPPHWLEPLWLRYGAVAVVERRVTLVGDDERALFRLERRLRGQAGSRPPMNVVAEGGEAGGQHVERIQRALELIRAGDLYQVNLARRLDYRVSGDALGLLEQLNRLVRAPFAAALELGAQKRVVSTSPELFLRTDPLGWAHTEPIKGTRPRGADAQGDREQRCALASDPKEHAELAMIIDVERNDLGRLALPGSVSVREPRIVAHKTVFHRQAWLSARYDSQLTRTELLRAMLPSGSVTGAPKVRAMEVIAELESERRGVYTGAFGALQHDGCLNLALAIRTLSVRENRGHYHVGGGIVLDSDPERELAETGWKSAQATRLLL